MRVYSFGNLFRDILGGTATFNSLLDRRKMDLTRVMHEHACSLSLAMLEARHGRFACILV